MTSSPRLYILYIYNDKGSPSYAWNSGTTIIRLCCRKRPAHKAIESDLDMILLLQPTGLDDCSGQVFFLIGHSSPNSLQPKKLGNHEQCHVPGILGLTKVGTVKRLVESVNRRRRTQEKIAGSIQYLVGGSRQTPFTATNAACKIILTRYPVHPIIMHAL